MPDWGDVAEQAAPYVAAGVDMWSTSQNNAANLAMAQRQMDFQERMSNTAYQRAMLDMRAAGLNPAMMYGKGAAASTPNGAMAEMNPVGAGAVSSALQVKMQQRQMKLLDEQTEAAKMTARKTRFEARQAGLAADMDTAKFLYYFNDDGTPKPALRKLLDAENAGALATNARMVAESMLAQYDIPEREAWASLIERAGSGPKLFQLLTPLAAAALRKGR